MAHIRLHEPDTTLELAEACHELAGRLLARPVCREAAAGRPSCVRQESDRVPTLPR